MNRPRGTDSKQEIDELRHKLGLREIVPTVIECLRCKKYFRSEDPYSTRLCMFCNELAMEAVGSTGMEPPW